MFFDYIRQRTKQAVLEGVAEAADVMSRPRHEAKLEAPVAVVVSRLEASLLGEDAPAAIPLQQPAAGRRPKV